MVRHESFGGSYTATANVDPWAGTHAGATGWDRPAATTAVYDPYARGIPMSNEVSSYTFGNNDPFAAADTVARHDTVGGPNHELGERVKERFRKIGGAIVDLSGILAKGSDMARRFMPGSKIDQGFAAANGYMETGFSVAGGVQNTHNVMQTAWQNRDQVAQAAMGYGKEAGYRVAGAGASAAMDVMAKRAGISLEQGDDGKNRLKIRKLKLAKFAIKFALSGGSYGAKVGVEAAMAARKGAVSGAMQEYKVAKQSGIDMAGSVWNGNNPFANMAPATAHANATGWERSPQSDGW